MQTRAELESVQRSLTAQGEQRDGKIRELQLQLKIAQEGLEMANKYGECSFCDARWSSRDFVFALRRGSPDMCVWR